jgi:hypothetical protein
MHKNLYLISLLLILTSSCEYEPHGEYFRDIDPVDPEEALLQLNLHDTVLYMEGQVDLIYNISFLKQEVLQVEFYLDDWKEATLYNAIDKVSIDPLDGRHKLKMVIYSSTESGTLADAVRAEAFVYEKEWTLMVDREGKEPITLNLEEQGGSMVLNWTKKDGIDFHSYVIFRQHNNGFFPMDTIWDPEITTLTDHDILGGEISYYVELCRSHLPDVIGEVADYPGMYYDLRIDVENGVQATISWSPCILHGNLDSYVLWQSIDGGQMTSVYTSNEVNDTLFILPLTENRYFSFKVEYVSVGDQVFNEELTHALNYFNEPVPIPYFRTISQSVFEPYSAVSDAFYYDAEGDRINPIQIPGSDMLMVFSPDNRFILSGKTLWEYVDNSYQEHHNLPLLPDRYLNADSLIASIPLGANIGYFELGQEAVLYDLQTDNIIYSFPDAKNSEGLLSPDGRIFSSRYQYNNATLFIYHTTDFVTPTRAFQDFESGPLYISYREFYIKKSGRLEHWLYKSLTHIDWDPIYPFPFFSGKLLAYDPVSATILTILDGNLRVHDPSDMSVIAERYIGDTYLLERGHFAYMNKKVFLRETNTSTAVVIKMLE